MTVRRIIANFAAPEPLVLATFYRDLLDLEVAMDMGWIVTLESSAQQSAQISIASHGGSNTPVPDLSIEVDDVDAVLARARQMGLSINYGIADEPWGVRRFYVRDPSGRLLNILSHAA